MRLRPVLTPLAALCSLALVFGGCSDDGGDDDGGGTSTTSTAADGGSATTGVEAGDADVDCDAYTTLTSLFESTEGIATGSNEQQVAADEALAESVEALQPAAEGDQALGDALDTLAQVSFQVTDSDEGPSADEVDAAIGTLEDAWSETCPAPGTQPTDPETGTTAPTEDGGTETTVAEGGASEPETTVPECPAPEVLEAEGFSCDENGQLTPLDEETATECPAPEVLEAEGYTCDENGQLTPVEGE